MARAVQVVVAVGPHVLTGKGVKLGARRSTRELAQLELYVPFKHEGVDKALLVGDWAKRNGARYVSGSVKILRA